MATRTIKNLIPGVETSDGAGVRIRRSLGSTEAARLDPFLMLDEFGSEHAGDYIAGFPPHPHRGFETVTYMLDGRMLHEDHLGNRGELGGGDVQWMTAGRGIVHSEMPQQESGLMRGFQLWLNLPAADKLCEPRYRDIPSEAIPQATADGATVRVIAGTAEIGGQSVAGAVTGAARAQGTDPLYLDIHLDAGARFEQALTADHSAAIYVYAGEVSVERPDRETTPVAPVTPGTAAVLSDGDRVTLRSGDAAARCLLLAGRPLREPLVQYGPFVMNSREEIEQAIRDYQEGTLARPATREAAKA